MQIKKHIPNGITCLNLFSGALACVTAFNGDMQCASFLILLAAVFDFLDGAAARLLKAYSPMGKELDSLADVISFGMAPGVMVYMMLCSIIEQLQPTVCDIESTCVVEGLLYILPYAAFILTVFSALRLAKFNIDDRQTTSFVGLPVPANALFWIGIVSLSADFQSTLWFICVLILMIFFFSWLLLAEIPMFSLKFTNFSLRENALRYLLIVLALLFISLWGIGGFTLTIIAYILISVISNMILKR